ncbi:efflux RND transporter periplasmic adaptor subunit [Amorphoplanes digitatis]|uniref:Peptidoglycan hydrolase-like protein with peptidoglycan-binding domain n=1 Tax=Actinoplanes digitatis TaxID=1868 RepID=A0A7W7I4G1_9ACTN|nr:peptidoglycan-binding protein [Actinoplanes digitatis]MBB4766053.1 peptidoglycan hydrolase-like protein with peptidoglycan-binding domain [Actinoplanes digitatis]GID97903.1 peptidoglycan-binding protein [Actinoplanes digitatis]
MRRRLGIAVAAAAALTAGAAVVVVAGLPDGQAEAEASVPPLTAEVKRETLVDTQDADGELGYGDTTAHVSRLSGTVTWLAAAESTVRRGKPLYRVDDDPVVLLYGSLPAYRTLSAGDTGRDVKQFEKNLWALGYRGFTVDRTYSSATASAVRDWQDDLGLEETGKVDPARIVYAPGAVRVAAQSAAPGAAAQPGTALLDTTGTGRVATVELDISDQRLVRKGAAVRVTLPDGTEAPGRITEVETVVTPAEGNEDASTSLSVTIAFEKAPKGLDQAAVTVAFTASERKNVLTVPVSALLALAEGGYGLQVVEGGSARYVAVETGLFADGRVEVSGGGIKDGMQVGMPE